MARLGYWERWLAVNYPRTTGFFLLAALTTGFVWAR